MGLYKIILHSCESVEFITASFALEKVMNWDVARSHQFCKEAHEKGSSLLCIASSQKAHYYISELEKNGMIVEKVPI